MRLVKVGLLSVALAGAACSSGPQPTGAPVEPDALAAPDNKPAAPASAGAEHHADEKVTAPLLAPEKAAAVQPASPGTADIARAATPPTAVREVTVPAGTTLSLTLNTTVSSQSSKVEEPVQGTLRSPVIVDGHTVIPAGATISGHVTEATRSGRVKGRARVGVRFSSLRIDDARYAIGTESLSRQAPTTKKQDAATIGVGAGAGAITGAIIDGKKGAAIGAAAGAGGGTAVVLSTRGEEVAISRGTVVTARLTEPITIRVH